MTMKRHLSFFVPPRFSPFFVIWMDDQNVSLHIDYLDAVSLYQFPCQGWVFFGM